MNILKVTSLLALVSASPIAFGFGDHEGGHKGNHGDAHWMAPAREATKKNPVKSSDDSVAMGSTLYQTNCSSCHGATGEGDGVVGKALNPKPANLREMAGTHPDGDFAYKISTGRGVMPGWKGQLAEDEIWHLVNYIQSLEQNEKMTDQSEEHKHEKGHGHSS